MGEALKKNAVKYFDFLQVVILGIKKKIFIESSVSEITRKIITFKFKFESHVQSLLNLLLIWTTASPFGILSLFINKTHRLRRCLKEKFDCQ